MNSRIQAIASDATAPHVPPYGRHLLAGAASFLKVIGTVNAGGCRFVNLD